MQDRQCVLGEIVEGSMVLSPAGLIVEEEWRRTATVRQHVELDDFVVMPNHHHGILVINEGPRKDVPPGPLYEDEVNFTIFGSHYRTI